MEDFTDLICVVLMLSKFSRLKSGELLFNACPLRQRILLLSAFVAMVYLVWFLSFDKPISTIINRMHTENTYLYSQLQDKDKARLSKIDDTSGLLELSHKLTLLKGEVDALNAELKRYFSVMVSIDELLVILRGILALNSDLIVDSVAVMPTETIAMNTYLSLLESSQINRMLHDDPLSEVVFNKHVVKVTFEGDYLAVLRYLHEIESLKWNIFMQRITYKVTAYPEARVELFFYTLSLEGDSFDA
jgi:MSHA biogenesis protein MshJ